MNQKYIWTYVSRFTGKTTTEDSGNIIMEVNFIRQLSRHLTPTTLSTQTCEHLWGSHLQNGHHTCSGYQRDMPLQNNFVSLKTQFIEYGYFVCIASHRDICEGVGHHTHCQNRCLYICTGFWIALQSCMFTLLQQFGLWYLSSILIWHQYSGLIALHTYPIGSTFHSRSYFVNLLVVVL